MNKENETSDKQQNGNDFIHNVVCSYSPFPQTLKAGKRYRILAKYKDRVAVIDETKELVTYNKCYFDFP